MSDNKELQDVVARDTDGMLVYEYLANNAGAPGVDVNEAVEALCGADRAGQFTASAARFLHAVDAEAYAGAVDKLLAATIDRDREHRYLPDLLLSIYGPDYEARAAELSGTDNNFRRMYKRVHPASAM